MPDDEGVSRVAMPLYRKLRKVMKHPSESVAKRESWETCQLGD